MPEGDTIFRAARTLRRALAGKPVTRFESVLADLTRVHEDTPITGRTVEDVSAAGKHLLIHLSGGLVLRTHMRMNGSWHIYRPGEHWQRPRRDMRLLLGTDDFIAVGFNVPVAEFLTQAALVRHSTLRRLGPDLLAPQFDEADARARIRARGDVPICDVLLDQQVMAGIGNVYKSEVLFVCRIDPFARVRDLDEAAVSCVIATARRLLRINAEGSGTMVTRPGLRRTTGRHDPGARLWVYGRGGRPCRRCGTPVASRAHGPAARLTYWCPACQHARPAGRRTSAS